MTTGLDFAAPEPLYRQVESYIETLIRERQLGPNDAIPSLGELARHLGVNNLTVRRAVRELSLRGVVVTRQGRGTFVKPRESRYLMLAVGPMTGAAHRSVFVNWRTRFVSRLAQRHGYPLHLAPIDGNGFRDVERQMLETGAACGVIGMFKRSAPAHQLLKKLSVPYVTIFDDDARSTYAVGLDLGRGVLTCEAARRLAQRGVQRVVYGCAFAPMREEIAQWVLEHPLPSGVTLDVDEAAQARQAYPELPTGVALAESWLTSRATEVGIVFPDHYDAQDFMYTLLERGVDASEIPPVAVMECAEAPLPLPIPVTRVQPHFAPLYTEAVELLCEVLRSGHTPRPRRRVKVDLDFSFTRFAETACHAPSSFMSEDAFLPAG